LTKEIIVAPGMLGALKPCVFKWLVLASPNPIF
jgi:hypothetical protein